MSKGHEPQPVDRQFSTSLARGMQVLRAFTIEKPLLGNREICDRTGLPKATVSRLTYTLTLLGYLAPVRGMQKYRLASGVLSLGYPFLASQTVRQAVRPIMARLAQQARCTVNLGMQDKTRVVFVETCRFDESNSYRPDIGSDRPALATSVGRALLLANDAVEQEAILNRMRLEDPAEFERLLPIWRADRRHFARHGYCRSRGDWQKEIHGIAVPVKRPLGEERIALNCTVTRAEAEKGCLENKVAPLLLSAASEIERMTGLA